MAQGKKEKQKKWQDYLILICLVIVLLIFTKATWGLYQKNQLALENLRLSVKKVEKLTEREAVLRDKIERLKTGRGVEEEIRNNFPVVKAGERVINIVENDKKTNITNPTSSKWWQIW